MSYWPWAKSNTMKEELESAKKLAAELEKASNEDKVKYAELEKAFSELKAKNKKMKRHYLNIASNVEKLISEQEVTKFILFCISVQSGGCLELTNETIQVAKKMYETHDISYEENDLNVSYKIKRREQEVKE